MSPTIMTQEAVLLNLVDNLRHKVVELERQLELAAQIHASDIGRLQARIGMKDDALSSMVEIYEKIQTYLGIDPGDMGKRADGEILHRIHALNTRIAELEQSLAGLGAKATRFENDREYNAELVRERDARIAELEHAFDRQKEYIARLEAAQRWMPVGDRLPEAGERYPGYSADVLSMSGTRPEWIYLSCYKYEDGEWFDIVTDDVIEGVTHWMPLPEPPEVTA